MPTFNVAVNIVAPVQRIYDVLTDLEHAADNIRGITKVELLTDQPFGPGTRWIETRTMMGREATEEMTIDSVNPPHGYTVTAQSHGNRYHTTISVTPATTGTDPDADPGAHTVRMKFTSTPVSLSAKLLGPLMMLMARGMILRCLSEDLDDIRRVCEATTTDQSRPPEAGLA